MYSARKEKAMLRRCFEQKYRQREYLEALKIYQSFSLLYFYRMERKSRQMQSRAG